MVQAPVKDNRKEIVGWEDFKTIKGLYHETTSYITKSTDQGSSINRKSSPMILCTAQTIAGLETGMRILYNNKKYTLVEIKDLAESGIIFDLSLEEIQDGGQF